MIEVLKQALQIQEELLRNSNLQVEMLDKLVDSIEALRQAIKHAALDAIAENEKELGLGFYEPVAWWNDTGTHIDLNVSGRGKPLYTHPQPKREGEA